MGRHPTLYTDQVIVFVRLSPESASAYLVRGAQGAVRDSIVLSADSARALFAAMRGATPIYRPPLTAYLSFQVRRQAQVIPGTRAPEYPVDLVRDGAGGRVLARFVVDSTGKVPWKSVQIVASTNEALTRSVQNGLLKMRFQPAQIDGRNVAEVIEMPFRFHLASGPSIDVGVPQ